MSKLTDAFRRAIGRAPKNITPEKKTELMNGTVLTTPSTSLRAAWQLTKPYFTRSEERRKAQVMLAMVVGMTLGQVYLDVKLSNWGNAFYKNLQQAGQILMEPETPEANAKAEQLKGVVKDQLVEFLMLAGLLLGVAITKTKVNQKLQLNWRQWMTQQYTDKWINKDTKAYYHMKSDGAIADNPDQRITDDIRIFTGSTLGLSMGFLRSTLSLPSFTYILWDLAGPAFVAGAAGYALGSTLIAHKVGKPLVKLSQDQQKYEANLRYAYVKARDNTESIGMQNGDGEKVESGILMERLEKVVQNQNKIINKNMQMTAINATINQTAIVAPYIIMLPQFFGRKLDLGDFFQGAGAFRQVQSDLSWFFDSYTELADWKSVANRLTGFSESIQKHQPPTPPAQTPKVG